MEKSEAKSAIESYLFKVQELMADKEKSNKAPRTADLESSNQKYRVAILNMSGHLNRLTEKYKLNQIHGKRIVAPSVDQKLLSLSKSIDINSK